VLIESRACSPVRPDAACRERRPERRPSALDSTIDDVEASHSNTCVRPRNGARRSQARRFKSPRAGLGGFETEDAGVSGLGPRPHRHRWSCRDLRCCPRRRECRLGFETRSPMSCEYASSASHSAGVNSGGTCRGQQYARANQGAGLEAVHGLEFFEMKFAAHGGEIQRLAARHSLGAARIREI